MAVLALPARGHDLVGGDRDRADLLAFAAVFADLVLGQGRARDELALPLPAGHGIRDEDQRGRLRLRHRRRTHERLARAARKHDHAGAPLPERVGRVALVIAQVPAVLAELHRVRLAVDVTGQVFGRPADLEQRLLEAATLGRVHHDGVVVYALTEHRRDLL